MSNPYPDLKGGSVFTLDNSSLITSHGTYTSATIRPPRVVDSKPIALRYLKKKDGTRVLQVATSWRCGSEGGIEWRDVPEELEE